MKMSVPLIFLLLACDGSPLKAPVAKENSIAPASPTRSSFAYARTPFDKKRVCAEEGKKYFVGLKLGEGKLPDEDVQIGGPLFAYNAAFDTCLCEYFVHRRDLAVHSGYDAGYIDRSVGPPFAVEESLHRQERTRA